MINTIYRLVAPKRIEVAFEEQPIKEETIVVRPKYMSICHADQRYYQGLRPPEVLEKKLPMALIHEAIGEVVYSKDETVPVGSQVVMIPNQPTETDEIIAENYLRSSYFRSSGYDGFMQEYVYSTANRLVVLPEAVPYEVAAFTELISVGYHAISRFLKIAHERRERIGIWGDGNLGYIVALLLKILVPGCKVAVIGRTGDKLSNFTFVDETYRTHLLPKDFAVDHAFECVGGQFSAQAINQMIDVIQPEGTISLLGVSELEVGINTRMVLEKGLRLFGSSRSGREDFVKTVELLEKHAVLWEYLGTLVTETVQVHGMKDITKAFDVDMRKQMGKVVLEWKV